MAGVSGLIMPVQGLVCILPACLGQKGVSHILDSGIEIAAENLREALRILGRFLYYNLRLLCFCGVGDMVQVGVQDAELPAGLAVAQAYPVAVAGPGGIPGYASSYVRGLGEPVATFGNQLITLLAEEYHILSDEVISAGVGIHLGAFEAESDIARQFLFQVVVRLVDHFLHADDVRFAGFDDLETYVFPVIPAPAVDLVCIKACDADVASHHIMC